MTSFVERHVETEHGTVPMDVRIPRDETNVGILLAHGAGAGRTHPWMVQLADVLVDRNMTVMTFDYSYMAAGRKAPDRLGKLLDVHEAAASVCADHVDRLMLAGKSMGGRVGGHLVADGRASPEAIAYLGYPLVAVGKNEPRPTDHLAEIPIPQLFVSGDRDRMGPSELIEDVVGSVPDGRLVLVETGDHSLVPLKRSGRTLDDSFAEVGTALSDLAQHIR